MAELTTTVVPRRHQQGIIPPPQRGALRFRIVRRTAVSPLLSRSPSVGAGGAAGHEVPSYLEADGADVMRQRVFGTCVAHAGNGPPLHRRYHHHRLHLTSTTCVAHVQDPLRWGVDRSEADWVCCENRHYAERAGRWTSTAFLTEHTEATVAASGPITFYDSVTGLPLFKAPIGRSWHDFVHESRAHGWPSFRDAELLPAYVRILPNGETVSVNGTHLGHNLLDSKGNRYCINLCSVAGPRRVSECV